MPCLPSGCCMLACKVPHQAASSSRCTESGMQVPVFESSKMLFAVALERTAWQQPVSAGAISDRGKQAVGAPALRSCLLTECVGAEGSWQPLQAGCIVTVCSSRQRSLWQSMGRACCYQRCSLEFPVLCKGMHDDTGSSVRTGRRRSFPVCAAGQHRSPCRRRDHPS